MITAAVLAPNAISRVLNHLERLFDKLDLLEDALVLRSFR